MPIGILRIKYYLLTHLDECPKWILKNHTGQNSSHSTSSETNDSFMWETLKDQINTVCVNLMRGHMEIFNHILNADLTNCDIVEISETKMKIFARLLRHKRLKVSIWTPLISRKNNWEISKTSHLWFFLSGEFQGTIPAAWVCKHKDQKQIKASMNNILWKHVLHLLEHRGSLQATPHTL